MKNNYRNIPFLILHGWNLSAEKFVPLVEEFKNRGYKAHSFDLPGFGICRLPEKSLYLSDYVTFVDKLIRKYQYKNVIIIGHSFGGRIGIKLATSNPKYLQALILTGAPGINPVPAAKIRFYLILAKTGQIIFSLPGLSLISDFARRWLYKMAKATDFYNTNKNMRQTFKNIIGENLEPTLSKISVPTLLLWGADDRIVPLNIGYKMAKLIKNSKFISIPQTRHGVPWTAPQKFVDEVEKFLAKL